jgi:hypothetical protein
LPGFGDSDALDVLAALPEMCVFSSDFPHHEGNAEPIELYRPGLDELAPDRRAAFLGGTMQECYARMGDPLRLAHPGCPDHSAANGAEVVFTSAGSRPAN